jgi:hypothetical protein
VSTVALACAACPTRPADVRAADGAALAPAPAHDAGAASTAPVPPPPSTVTDAGKGGVLLYDPHSSAHDAWGGAFERTLSERETKRVLDQLFGHKYLADLSKCGNLEKALAGIGDDPDGSRALAAERKLGLIAPQVEQVAQGSFTRSHVSEVLYVIQTTECSASPPTWGSTTLAVFEGGKVVARGVDVGNTRIVRVVDLDGDGRDELVVMQGFAWGGLAALRARVAQFAATGLVTQHDFGQVLEDRSASSGLPDDGKPCVTYSVLYANPRGLGLSPFRVEQGHAPCETMTEGDAGRDGGSR